MTHRDQTPWDLERPHVCAAVTIGALVLSVAMVAWILAIALAP